MRKKLEVQELKEALVGMNLMDAYNYIEHLEQENKDLKDALEDAQNGLRHYEDGKPDKADDELHERIDKLNPKEGE